MTGAELDHFLKMDREIPFDLPVMLCVRPVPGSLEVCPSLSQ